MKEFLEQLADLLEKHGMFIESDPQNAFIDIWHPPTSSPETFQNATFGNIVDSKCLRAYVKEHLV